MALAESDILHAVAEYLALERAAEERHEYVDGRIYAMAGESEEHGIICVNLVREMSSRLRSSPCQVFTNNMKVRSGPVPSAAILPGACSLILMCSSFVESASTKTSTGTCC